MSTHLKSAFMLGAAIAGLSAGGAFAAVTTSDALNVMSGPDTNTRIVAKLDADTTVSLGRTSGDWCQITAPSKGWVACANLDGLARTNLSANTGWSGYDYSTDPYLGPNAPTSPHYSNGRGEFN